MKTSSKKKLFKSNSIVELNNSTMNEIHGGSMTFFVEWVQDKIDDAHEQMSPWI